jgi:hypothetical protein
MDAKNLVWTDRNRLFTVYGSYSVSSSMLAVDLAS